MKQTIKNKTEDLNTILQNQTLSKRKKFKVAIGYLIATVGTFPLPVHADASTSGYDFVKAFLAWIFLIAGFILLAAGIVVLAQGVFGESSGGNRNTGIGLIIGSFACFAVAAIFAFLPPMPQYKAS